MPEDGLGRADRMATLPIPAGVADIHRNVDQWLLRLAVDSKEEVCRKLATV